jgi:hypothetical protein
MGAEEGMGAEECILEVPGTLGAAGGPMAEERIMEAESISAEELVIIVAEESAAITAADLVTIVAHMVSIVATVMAGDLDLEDMG